MPRIEPLGLKAFDSLHFYVRDLARARSLLVDKLDFAELGESDDALTANGRQKSIVFQAGQIRFVVSEPRGEGGRAARFLRKHPEGVGTVAFEVEDIDRCWALLEARGGTPITDIQRFEDGDGNGAPTPGEPLFFEGGGGPQVVEFKADRTGLDVNCEATMGGPGQGGPGSKVPPTPKGGDGPPAEGGPAKK